MVLMFGIGWRQEDDLTGFAPCFKKIIKQNVSNNTDGGNSVDTFTKMWGQFIDLMKEICVPLNV